MKQLIIVLCTFFLVLSSQAQLAGSSWKATLNLDSPLNTIFHFTNDTLEVVSADDNSPLETMKYTVGDSVLTLQKLYGESACSAEVIGNYKYKINEEQMVISVLSDSCDDRRNAIGVLELNRLK